MQRLLFTVSNYWTIENRHLVNAVLKSIAMNQTGRNKPCPCGSGKKYKKCHGQISKSISSTPDKPVNIQLGRGVVDEQEWKKMLRAQHKDSLLEYQRHVKDIEQFVAEIEPVETICHISYITDLGHNYENSFTHHLTESPLLYFLIGLYIKHGAKSNREPTGEDIEKIVTHLKHYFFAYSRTLTFRNSYKEGTSEADGVKLSAQLQKIITPINPSRYRFQTEELLTGVFPKLDAYFAEKYGFTASAAIEFGKMLLDRYQNLINHRQHEILRAKQKFLDEIEHPDTGPKLKAEIQSKGMTVDAALQRYMCFLLFTDTKSMFVFTPEQIIEEYKIANGDEFKNYLAAFSCKFGMGNTDYETPMDDNLIYYKPIVSVGDNLFFCPVHQDLLDKLPLGFELLLHDEKQRGSAVWEQYQSVRNDYTESKTIEFLQRLNPAIKIHRNLLYDYGTPNCETDALIQYDNRILIAEVKAGAFSESAKLGKQRVLKKDLKSLIENAFEQGRRTREYMKANTKAQFRMKDGSRSVEISVDKDKTEYFLINVTLEPLMILGTSLKELQSLGFFTDNEYPWSVNLFELDILTRHVDSFGIFIHYLEQRRRAMVDNVYSAFDELSYFALYLEYGNFYPLFAEDGKPYSRATIDGGVEIFDKHYLEGAPAPILKLEPQIRKFVAILETQKPFGYTKILCALLDLPHNGMAELSQKMAEFYEKAKSDGKGHDCSTSIKNTVNLSISFVAQKGTEHLNQFLFTVSMMTKYKAKVDRCVGIGRIVDDPEFYAFVYFESKWEYDAKFEKILAEK